MSLNLKATIISAAFITVIVAIWIYLVWLLIDVSSTRCKTYGELQEVETHYMHGKKYGCLIKYKGKFISKDLYEKILSGHTTKPTEQANEQ